MDSLRGKATIVGVGETEKGSLPHLNSAQLYVKAAKAALQDAGIGKTSTD